MYDAIILAGGENRKDLAGLSPQKYEALIEIDGRPMVTFVAQALADSQKIDRIFVCGPDALADCLFPANTTLLAGGRTIMETIMTGMNALGHQDKVLVATADIPLLTPAAVNDFLAKCSMLDADLYYPIVNREMNERYYPGTKRTYVRLREGVFTGGNLFLVNPKIVPACLAIGNRLIEHRKNPWKLCRILGWTFVWRLLTQTLSLKLVEKRVSDLLQIRGTVIQSGYPELGIDIDKPSDLKLVNDRFRRLLPTHK